MVEKKEAKKRSMVDTRVIIASSIQFLSPYSFTSMPKDTRDPSALCHEMILMILRMADEDLLKESGNAVYHRMKRDLDKIQCAFFF